MSAINNLNAADSINGSDLVPIWSQYSGDARKISANMLADFVGANVSFVDAVESQYFAPLTGTTLSVLDNKGAVWLILTPAGTLANLTLLLPAVANVLDHQELVVNSTQTLTALTINGNGASVVGGPTTLAANGFFRLRFDAVLKTWYRIG